MLIKTHQIKLIATYRPFMASCWFKPMHVAIISYIIILSCALHAYVYNYLYLIVYHLSIYRKSAPMKCHLSCVAIEHVHEMPSVLYVQGIEGTENCVL